MRKTLARDMIGTAIFFLLLVGVVIAMMLLEKFLDNFKAH